MVLNNIQTHRDYSDEIFVGKFEDLSLEPHLFSHEAHLRLAYIYLQMYNPIKALAKIRKGIQKFDQHFSKGEKYHETITTALVKIIEERIRKQNSDSWVSFVENNKDLLKFKKILERYYSLKLLASAEAKKTFLNPDIITQADNAKSTVLNLVVISLSIIFLSACNHSSEQPHSKISDSTAHHQSADSMTQHNKLIDSGVRVSQSATIILNGQIEEVFPLFGPELEKKWAEGWDFKKILFETELGEEYSVFQTKSSSNMNQITTWIISKLEPHENPKVIEYITFNPDWITIVNIVCKPESNQQKTSAAITYTYTSLTDIGSEKVPSILNKMYSLNMKDWEEAINYYLENGTLLIH